jgi:AraC-like DNA-binding protein
VVVVACGEGKQVWAEGFCFPFHPILNRSENSAILTLSKFCSMAIYMDLHIVPGVNAKDVADAHSMDVLMEKEHSCKCLTYWIDELRGYVFCLIDAPDKESVIELHTRAHGLVPNKIIEVESSLVHAFLGRITDPENAYVTDNGLMILDDTSYRIIMNLQLDDYILLQQKAGTEKAMQLMQQFKTIAKNEILKNNGREVANESNEMIASFVEGGKAFAAALAIQQQLSDHADANLRISLHAGEPVMQSDKLFGDTVQMLKRLNMFNRTEPIVITSGIRELLDNETLKREQEHLLLCTPKDETFVTALFELLEAKYGDETFDMDTCCTELAMSQSQLYRKATQLFQLSPNNLLRNFRLLQAKELLRTTDKTVSQISFETGFASASYFTKCFKSYFNVLPLAYRDLQQQKAG